MSLFRRKGLATAGLAGLLALAAAGGLASPASAASVQLDYACNLRIAGAQPVRLSLDTQSDLPLLTAKIDLGGQFKPAIDTTGAVKVTGDAYFELAVEREGEATKAVNVSVPLGDVDAPFQSPIRLEGDAALPTDEIGTQPVRVKVAKFASVLHFFRANGEEVPSPGIPVDPSYPVPAIEPGQTGWTIPCKLGEGQDSTLIQPTDPQGVGIPGVPNPSAYVPGDFGLTSINVKWLPVVGAKEYVIEYDDGQVVRVPAGANTGIRDTLITGLGQDSEYVFSISAVDDAGNQGESSEQLLATLPLPPVDNQPPSPPTGLRVESATSTTVTLRWNAATDNVGVVGYDVFNGPTKVATVVGTSVVITGLAPNGAQYTFGVEARDAAGNPSRRASLAFSRVVEETSLPFVFGATGSATLKTLIKGNVPLAGSLNGTIGTGLFGSVAGRVEGDLALGDASARLTALGFLPVTAKLGFAASGKTTGDLVDSKLTLASKVRIKVKEAKLFGAFPIVAGNSCQTKQLVDLKLASAAGGFSASAGGSVSGTFAISDLNGCGGLTGLVSPVTAGGGNSITLKLTPKG